MYSDMVEDAIKTVRGFDETATNGRCARRLRWHNLQQGTLLQDRDRPQPSLVPAVLDQARANTLPNAMFEAERHEFSLGMEALLDMASPSWPSLAPLTFNLAPTRTQALLQAPNPASVEKSWRSLLAEAGSGLFRDDVIGGLLVLRVSYCGLWAWNVGLMR